MKRMILCAAILLGITVLTMAQKPLKTQKSYNAKESGTVKSKAPNKNIRPFFVLNSINNYQAKNNNTINAGFAIADPIVRSLNERTLLNERNVDAPIIGVPKSSFGLANGHITFLNSGGTTSGTSTGSGAVGTGTALGSLGTNGTAIGVNGKSPYAGTGVYGIPLRGIGETSRAGSNIRLLITKEVQNN